MWSVHLFGSAPVGWVDDLGPVDDPEEGGEGGDGGEDGQHLEDAKVLSVEAEQDDGVGEPRGHAHGPRGELVVEEEPPRATAVGSMEEPAERARSIRRKSCAKIVLIVTSLSTTHRTGWTEWFRCYNDLHSREYEALLTMPIATPSWLSLNSTLDGYKSLVCLLRHGVARRLYCSSLHGNVIFRILNGKST